MRWVILVFERNRKGFVATSEES